MTNQPTAVAYIRPSQKFYGKYEVVVAQKVIPCHNYATARTLVKDINNGVR